MAQRTPYRVAIALNSAEEQAWVQDRLEQSQGWQVLFSTKDGETCLRQVLRDRPELVLIGDILRDMEGRELLRQRRWPRLEETLQILSLESVVYYFTSFISSAI